MPMESVIVLNSDYLFLSKTTVRRGLQLVREGKAEIVKQGRVIRSFYYEEIIPAILRIKNFIKSNFNICGIRNRKISYCRKYIFMRDHWTCQYCDKKLSENEATIDHIIPKSRKGVSNFLNCTTSCFPCNKRKGDMPVSEFGKPKITTYHPTYQQLLHASLNF
jgi:CRISPR/Cas system Type II protein with McrA/HNH and RuvC-like nuclease domain